MISEKELRILRILSKEFKSLDDLSKESGLTEYEVYRLLGFLSLKGLAEVEEETIEYYTLGDLGKKYLEKRLPETRLYNYLKNKKEATIEELKNILDNGELGIAIGILKKEGVIDIDGNKIILLKEDYKGKDHLLIEVDKRKINEEIINYFKKRKDIIVKKSKRVVKARITDKGEELLNEISQKEFIDRYTKQVLEKEEWKSREFRPYNIHIPIRPRKYGRLNKYLEFLEEIRDYMVSMGFKEMEDYNMITSHFWNFEALFVPQDHPSGEMSFTDIFVFDGELKDFNEELYNRVKEEHLKVFKKWDDKLPKVPMLISHVTAISARTLQKAEIPGRYFLIEKVFRYDTIDKTHFIEFTQLDGIVLDENITFKELLGILADLIHNVVGAKDVKFYPAYFPFTEPSVEAYAKHPKVGWMEVGGAGMFREELLRPFNINVPVIAWGLGIDRLAMIKLGIDDVRDIHTRRLKK